MREQTIIQNFSALQQGLSRLYESVKLSLSGEALQAEALKALLIKKGLITEQELTESMGEVIKKANSATAPQDPASGQATTDSGIVTPTPAQVASITNETPQ